MSRDIFRLMLLFIALLTCAITASVAYAHEGSAECPLCKMQNEDKVDGAVPTTEPKVCINGEAPVGPQKVKVTFNFLRKDGTPYRERARVRYYSGRWRIGFARSLIEMVLREEGSIWVCIGEKGEGGVHLDTAHVQEIVNDPWPRCQSRPVCLYPDLTCRIQGR